MADTKISALSSAGALAGTEPLPIVQGGVTVKTTVQDVANLAGSGNASITPITVAALTILQSGSIISTTTFYNVTNAVGSTRVLQVYAIANNTNVVWAVDVTTGEIGTYDITGDVFVGMSGVWGGITGDILDQTDVGARKDAAANVFIGANNDTNTITTSTNNIFYSDAGSNILLDTTNSIFGKGSEGNDLNTCNKIYLGNYASYNIFLNNEKYSLGDYSNGCEIEGGSQVKIGNYCTGIKLLETTNSVFGDFIINFDITTYPTPNFTLCTVASNLDFTTIDFTSATQLFARSNAWSINKVLGTDLIEVTFDVNLSTAQTGTYDTATDTFTPYAAGTGDVVGPASAVDNNIAVFDTITGKLIKDGGATIASLLPVAAAANYRLTVSDGSGNRGNAGAITSARALKSDANGVPTHFDTATEPSLTELSYVKGVGSQVVGISDTNTLTNKRITARTGTTTSSATPTINTDNVDYYSITALSAAITSFTTNLSGTPTIGQTLWISITDNGTARAITWGASFEASTIALPTTTVISTRLDVAFIWNDVTSKWRCVGTC